MSVDHSKAPFIEGLKNYHHKGMRAFTVPAHKMGKGLDPATIEDLGLTVFYNDIPVSEGVDDRKSSHGYQNKAEELAADAYGADHCYFSTNGTSLSVHAAILTVAHKGEKIIVVRNAHLSMISGIIMADVNPIFVEPEVDKNWDLAHGLDPEKLEKTLQDHPDAKGVFIVSPDYYGVCADVKSLAKICHKHNVPLIVDEAWGPHFAFSPELPDSAIKAGADLAMGSMHKTMTALGQSSVLLLKGKRISVDRFEECYRLFETTSPSSLIIASMDASRRYMKLEGEELWRRALMVARAARTAIKEIPGIKVLESSILGKPGCHQMDESRVVFSVKDLGISGFKATDWLWKEKKVALELAQHHVLKGMFTVADDEASFACFVEAIRDMANWARSKVRNTFPDLPGEHLLYSDLVMKPADAYFGEREKVNLKDAVGRIAGESVSPYPPGIPRLIPGERISQEIIDYLIKGRDAGMFQEDAADDKLKTILVAKE